MNKIKLIAGLTVLIAGVLYALQQGITTIPAKKAHSTILEKPIKKTGAEYFLEHEHWIRTRDGMDDPAYSTGYRHRAFQKAIAINKDQIRFRETLPWIERGPGNVGGRTRGLIVDPRDLSKRTWFAGSVGGGIWKTENGGETWRSLGEELTNLSTSTLAMSSANPEVIYAGTGEGFGGIVISGNGMWKSTDSGETWSIISSTDGDARFGNIMRIAVNPENENELVVCTRIAFRMEGASLAYIFKSTNGGNTWREVFQFNSAITQVIADPTDYNVMYAAIDNFGIIKSTDAGLNWETIFDISDESIGRLEIAIAPQNPSFLYASAESFRNDFELYRSQDGGENWNRIVGINGQNDFGSVFSGQGGYDNTIAVHPFNVNTVFVGGAGPIVEITATNEVIGSITIDELRNSSTNIGIAEVPVFKEGVVFAEDLAELFNEESTIEGGEYVNTELRFGLKNNQNAHRWTSNDGGTAYNYASYENIAFRAWDLKNDRQLMVSYFDVNEDGKWTLQDDPVANDSFEVVLVHAIPYEENPSALIQENPFHKAMYALFLYSSESMAVPGGAIEVVPRVSNTRGGILNVVADGYGEYARRFPNVGSKGVHVDHHNILLFPKDSIEETFYFINANDGGVAFSENSGETFIQTGDFFAQRTNNLFGPAEVSFGYNTAQFYGVDKMNGGDRYVGGTQDNGSWVSGVDPQSASNWESAPSGDGFEAAWHYLDSLKILESSQFNIVYRSDDGGESWRILNLGGQGPFITRLANSKQEPDLVFAVSREGVLRSDDFGDNWDLIKMPTRWKFSDFVPIEVSLASPLVVWTGDQMISNSRIAVSTDGGQSFEVTRNYDLAEMGPVTGLATHPYDPNTGYALFSFANGPKVLKTTDLGQTWEDLSGFEGNVEESNNGFPDVATYCLLVMPYDTNIIWVGTEIGLFESTDGGESWSYADNGLPPVSIWEMKIVNDEVVLATHGRGIWSVAIPELENYVIPDALLAPRITFEQDGFGGNLIGEIALRDTYDSTTVEIAIPGFENLGLSSRNDSQQ